MNRPSFLKRSLAAAALAVLPMPKRDETAPDDPVETVEFRERSLTSILESETKGMTIRWIRRPRIDFSEFPVE